MSFSIPHEPTWWQSLIECFESLQTPTDAEEADFFDSDGNEPRYYVKDHEFDHYEDSIDELLSGPNSEIPSQSKFVFLSNDEIDALKVDQLKLELLKKNLSNLGLKTELNERV